MLPGTVILRQSEQSAGLGAPVGWLVFCNPAEVLVAATAAEIPRLLGRVEAETSRGRWAAGFLAYEAAPALDPDLPVRTPAAGGLPLAWFGLYDAPESRDELFEAGAPYQLGPWRAALSPADYARRIKRIREYIAAGDTYQVNFTFPLRACFAGDPWALFLDLQRAQPGRHGGFVLTGPHAILSASPELFFAQSGDEVVTRPMKGTAPRGRWLEEDGQLAEALLASPKERAENVMIVDLLRNDLGRLARPGRVEVTRLFEIERYATVFQMTSTIRAQTPAGPVETLRTLFPCGSVTGAPKVRTMQIIAELEGAPRGVYTGALGWVGPGRRAAFSVPIRTVQLELARGEAVYGIGSGVTWDSSPEGEYQECRVKARQLGAPRPAFDLLETLLWEPETGYFLLERHLARLADSARYFGWGVRMSEVRAALHAAAAPFQDTPRRVRLLVGESGQARVESSVLLPEKTAPRWRVGLAAEPIDSRNPLFFNKTTARGVYERARRARPGLDDVLLWNERGELTESTLANLVVDFGDGARWTPPRRCGLLAGTFRQSLIEAGRLGERVILKEDLSRIKKMWLVNSVRRWVEAEWVL